jgi:hypothetical protein
MNHYQDECTAGYNRRIKDEIKQIRLAAWKVKLRGRQFGEPQVHTRKGNWFA